MLCHQVTVQNLSCAVNPCQNGGTCYETMDNIIMCDCVLEFTGAYCDIGQYTLHYTTIETETEF